MKFTAIDWFYGLCYVPKMMDNLRMANPTISDDRLRAVFSVLPILSEEELSDTSRPSHRVVDISLDNAATYFDMGTDYLDRPLDLSVACFDSEVLSRYDVRVEDSLVRCSEGDLRDVYVNSAGQVHVCICDLRDLSAEEKAHWKRHNVRPDLGWDSRKVAHPFHGIAERFVKTCLFNMPPPESPEGDLRDS